MIPNTQGEKIRGKWVREGRKRKGGRDRACRGDGSDGTRFLRVKG